MRNYEDNPVYRAILNRNDRRRSRRVAEREKNIRRTWLLANIKMTLLWLLYLVVLFLFISMVESAIPHRIVLKWFIIFTFFGVSVTAVRDIEKKIKKSPRNGHSDRGHMEK
ncbi:hypothetical protein [Anaerotignum sp.]|uniref:hypothetical protein n=1 Tax=Anaerotignum sp. TaxID=2039241 RepID=UPI003320619C